MTRGYTHVSVDIRANNLQDKAVMPVLYQRSTSSIPHHSSTEVLVLGVDELSRLLAMQGADEADVHDIVRLAFRRFREWRREQEGKGP